jgi:hypothetical protein
MADDALAQPVPAAVQTDALRIRRQGTWTGLLAAALFFGGLSTEQPLLLLAGAALLVVTLVVRTRQKRRVLAGMTGEHAKAVQAEMKRGASQPVISSAAGRVVAWAVAAILMWLLVLR